MVPVVTRVVAAQRGSGREESLFGSMGKSGGEEEVEGGVGAAYMQVWRSIVSRIVRYCRLYKCVLVYV